MELLWSTSHISGGNASYIEELYESYLQDPSAIAQEWRDYFDKLPRVNGAVGNDIRHVRVGTEMHFDGMQICLQVVVGIFFDSEDRTADGPRRPERRSGGSPEPPALPPD